MTLQVVRVPQPSPGVDWSAVVPGINIWAITGITAELDTTVHVGPAPQQLFYRADSGAGSTLEFVVQPVGLTQNQYELRSEAFPIGLSQPFPSLADGLAHMLAVVWDGAHEHYYLDGTPIGVAQAVAPSVIGGALNPGTLGEVGPCSTVVDELSTFRSALSAGQIAALYVDAAAGFATYSPAVLALAPATYYHFDGPGPVVCTDVSGHGNDGTYVELDAGPPIFVPGLVAGNDALGWGQFPGTNEVVVQPAPLDVDWSTPFTIIIWSMMLPGVPSTGRTPSLVVTNNTHDVLEIPPGFPAVATPGPYEYAWQPDLNADSQSTDGTLTTVAIPRLLVPAGYTVETRTPDIAPGDQWSNVVIQWDDAYQNALYGVGAYAFPGGIRLRYHQIGTP